MLKSINPFIILSMSTASEVLLIIVSAVLVIFLLVLIAATYYFIGVMRDIKRITQKAESAATAIEAAAGAFQKAATPLAIFKLAGKIFKKAKVNKE